MIEIIIEALFTPSRLRLGTAIGVVVAVCAWYGLPENIDRESIAAWSIAIGFIGGLALTFSHKMKK